MKKGQKYETFGTFGTLSFNSNKMITTSGGGALVVKDEAVKKLTMFYATQAREAFPYYQHEKIGCNYRMSNICAGIGTSEKLFNMGLCIPAGPMVTDEDVAYIVEKIKGCCR